ncbi:saccharopine dehydrogenase NADP-binding domain-containing protein [Nonomuraea sp. MCN248]|uniref:Saccharopine dehydrogenase NADP-binding domain-containing protein n=1 Tax=Nonomuraea corallina TaxID=2989783 RepID=A0ABT4SGZ0_9ACTN|nr:saccharopine dehydrogenase NADP-binding domain-containing protein [Nonomuraea corallina]MDA0636489.1 saccharopine dehydrogenase NADP-binding domain-containing protein [Nonomuraea corallina]
MTIAIYGANGHTGRLVAAELLARDQDIVLAGRNSEALRALAAELDSPRVSVHPAELDDAGALRELAAGSAALIHCAGPFTRTCEPLARAAVAGGCHYIDHAIEPKPVKWLFDTMQGPAQQAGVVMIPQLSFYGGLADLLAAAAASGLPAVDRVTIGYSISGWRMTPAAVRTAELLIGEIDRVTYTGGALRVGPVDIRNTVYPFPPPVGPRSMIAPFPSGEMVTIPRHVPARTVESQLTASTFEEEQVFTSQEASPEERARTTFMVAAQVVAEGGGGRTAHLRGRDIWWVGALASADAAVRLVGGDGPGKSGVLSTAEAFEAEPFLRRLAAQGAFELSL